MKYLWTIGIAVAILGFSFKNLSAGEHSKQFLKHLCQEQHQPSEEVLLDSLENLSFDQEGITLNAEEFSYEVHSLRKIGNQWMASLVNGLRYCPEGHPMCKNCELCHKPQCRYYIRPCKLWN